MAIGEVTGTRQNYIGMSGRRATRTYHCLIAEMASLRPQIGDLFTNLAGHADTTMDTTGMRVTGVSDGTMRGDKNVEFTVEASTNFNTGTLARPGLAVVRWKIGMVAETRQEALWLEEENGDVIPLDPVTGKAPGGYTLMFEGADNRLKNGKAPTLDLEIDRPIAGLALTTWQERVTESDIKKWVSAVGTTNKSDWMYFGRDSWKFCGVDTDPTDLKLVQLTFEFDLRPTNKNFPQGWQHMPKRDKTGKLVGPVWILYPRTNFNNFLPPFTELVMMGSDARHEGMNVVDFFRGRG